MSKLKSLQKHPYVDACGGARNKQSIKESEWLELLCIVFETICADWVTC